MTVLLVKLCATILSGFIFLIQYFLKFSLRSPGVLLGLTTLSDNAMLHQESGALPHSHLNANFKSVNIY